MPKIKTRRGMAKRFKLTKSGLVKRGKAGKSHILTKKSTKTKRNLRATTVVASAKEARTIKAMCPYI